MNTPHKLPKRVSFPLTEAALANLAQRRHYQARKAKLHGQLKSFSKQIQAQKTAIQQLDKALTTCTETLETHKQNLSTLQDEIDGTAFDQNSQVQSFTNQKEALEKQILSLRQRLKAATKELNKNIGLYRAQNAQYKKVESNPQFSPEPFTPPVFVDPQTLNPATLRDAEQALNDTYTQLTTQLDTQKQELTLILRQKTQTFEQRSEELAQAQVAETAKFEQALAQVRETTTVLPRAAQCDISEDTHTLLTELAKILSPSSDITDISAIPDLLSTHHRPQNTVPEQALSFTPTSTQLKNLCQCAGNLDVMIGRLTDQLNRSEQNQTVYQRCLEFLQTFTQAVQRKIEAYEKTLQEISAKVAHQKTISQKYFTTVSTAQEKISADFKTLHDKYHHLFGEPPADIESYPPHSFLNELEQKRLTLHTPISTEVSHANSSLEEQLAQLTTLNQNYERRVVDLQQFLSTIQSELVAFDEFEASIKRFIQANFQIKVLFQCLKLEPLITLPQDISQTYSQSIQQAKKALDYIDIFILKKSINISKSTQDWTLSLQPRLNVHLTISATNPLPLVLATIDQTLAQVQTAHSHQPVVSDDLPLELTAFTGYLAALPVDNQVLAHVLALRDQLASDLEAPTTFEHIARFGQQITVALNAYLSSQNLRVYRQLVSNQEAIETFFNKARERAQKCERLSQEIQELIVTLNPNNEQQTIPTLPNMQAALIALEAQQARLQSLTERATLLQSELQELIQHIETKKTEVTEALTQDSSRLTGLNIPPISMEAIPDFSSDQATIERGLAEREVVVAILSYDLTECRERFIASKLSSSATTNGSGSFPTTLEELITHIYTDLTATIQHSGSLNEVALKDLIRDRLATSFTIPAKDYQFLYTHNMLQLPLPSSNRKKLQEDVSRTLDNFFAMGTFLDDHHAEQILVLLTVYLRQPIPENHHTRVRSTSRARASLGSPTTPLSPTNRRDSIASGNSGSKSDEPLISNEVICKTIAALYAHFKFNETHFLFNVCIKVYGEWNPSQDSAQPKSTQIRKLLHRIKLHHNPVLSPLQNAINAYQNLIDLLAIENFPTELPTQQSETFQNNYKSRDAWKFEKSDRHLTITQVPKLWILACILHSKRCPQPLVPFIDHCINLENGDELLESQRYFRPLIRALAQIIKTSFPPEAPQTPRYTRAVLSPISVELNLNFEHGDDGVVTTTSRRPGPCEITHPSNVFGKQFIDKDTQGKILAFAKRVLMATSKPYDGSLDTKFFPLPLHPSKTPDELPELEVLRNPFNTNVHIQTLLKRFFTSCGFTESTINIEQLTTYAQNYGNSKDNLFFDRILDAFQDKGVELLKVLYLIKRILKANQLYLNNYPDSLIRWVHDALSAEEFLAIFKKPGLETHLKDSYQTAALRELIIITSTQLNGFSFRNDQTTIVAGLFADASTKRSHGVIEGQTGTGKSTIARCMPQLVQATCFHPPKVFLFIAPYPQCLPGSVSLADLKRNTADLKRRIESKSILLTVLPSELDEFEAFLETNKDLTSLIHVVADEYVVFIKVLRPLLEKYRFSFSLLSATPDCGEAIANLLWQRQLQNRGLPFNTQLIDQHTRQIARIYQGIFSRFGAIKEESLTHSFELQAYISQQTIPETGWQSSVLILPEYNYAQLIDQIHSTTAQNLAFVLRSDTGEIKAYYQNKWYNFEEFKSFELIGVRVIVIHHLDPIGGDADKFSRAFAAPSPSEEGTEPRISECVTQITVVMPHTATHEWSFELFHQYLGRIRTFRGASLEALAQQRRVLVEVVVPTNINLSGFKDKLLEGMTQSIVNRTQLYLQSISRGMVQDLIDLLILAFEHSISEIDITMQQILLPSSDKKRIADTIFTQYDKDTLSLQNVPKELLDLLVDQFSEERVKALILTPLNIYETDDIEMATYLGKMISAVFEHGIISDLAKKQFIKYALPNQTFSHLTLEELLQRIFDVLHTELNDQDWAKYTTRNSNKKEAMKQAFVYFVAPRLYIPNIDQRLSLIQQTTEQLQMIEFRIQTLQQEIRTLESQQPSEQKLSKKPASDLEQTQTIIRQREIKNKRKELVELQNQVNGYPSPKNPDFISKLILWIEEIPKTKLTPFLRSRSTRQLQFVELQRTANDELFDEALTSIAARIKTTIDRISSVTFFKESDETLNHIFEQTTVHAAAINPAILQKVSPQTCTSPTSPETPLSPRPARLALSPPPTPRSPRTLISPRNTVTNSASRSHASSSSAPLQENMLFKRLRNGHVVLHQLLILNGTYLGKITKYECPETTIKLIYVNQENIERDILIETYNETSLAVTHNSRYAVIENTDFVLAPDAEHISRLFQLAKLAQDTKFSPESIEQCVTEAIDASSITTSSTASDDDSSEHDTPPPTPQSLVTPRSTPAAAGPLLPPPPPTQQVFVTGANGVVSMARLMLSPINGDYSSQ